MKTKKEPSLELVKPISPRVEKSTTPSPSSPSEDSRANSEVRSISEVYYDFGIDPLEVSAAPEITDILIRSLGGSREQMPMSKIFNFLAASDSRPVKKFLQICGNESGKRGYDQLSIEALCVLAGVSPLKILNTVATVAKSLKANESALRGMGGEGYEAEEADADDKAWYDCFPSITDKLELWGERRRALSEDL